MVKMKISTYDKLIDKYERTVSTEIEEPYGLERKDLDTFNDNPDDYVEYAMFLLTRPYYANATNDITFRNKDALCKAEVIKELNAFLRKNLELV